MKRYFVGNESWCEWSVFDTKEEAIQYALDSAGCSAGSEFQVFEAKLLGTAYVPDPSAVFDFVKD